jgi:hypothetical protein
MKFVTSRLRETKLCIVMRMAGDMYGKVSLFFYFSTKETRGEFITQNVDFLMVVH